MTGLSNAHFHLTIIDSCLEQQSFLESALKNDFNIKAFSFGKESLDYIRNHHTDGVILEVQISDANGFDLYQDIKNLKPYIPIIFLTKDSSIESLEKGLSLGAEDYLIKSLSQKELIFRIRHRIMNHQSRPRESKSLVIKNLTIDIGAHQVMVDERVIKLTPKEYQLLLLLVQNPNCVLHKSDLLTILWKDVHVQINNLDTHFSNLRRKLKPFSNNIKTLKNLGYVLRI